MVSYWNTSVLLTPWILFGFTFPCFRIRAAEFIKSLGLSKFDFYLRNGRWKQARKKKSNSKQNGKHNAKVGHSHEHTEEVSFGRSSREV